MTHKLDDWWQTPLGDSGKELRDLIVETMQALIDQLETEKRLDEETRNSFKQVIDIMDIEYKKLIDSQ